MIKYGKEMFDGLNSNTVLKCLILYKTINTTNLTKEERADKHIELIKLIKGIVGKKKQGKLLEEASFITYLKDLIVFPSRQEYIRNLENKLFIEDLLKVILLPNEIYKYNKVDFTKYQYIGTKGKVIPESKWKIEYPEVGSGDNLTFAASGLTDQMQTLFSRLGLEQVSVMITLFVLIKARCENSFYFNLSLEQLNNLLLENRD